MNAIGMPMDQTSGAGNTQGARIELHLRNLDQLFESLDPAPFREKDLDRSAEEYIFESASELDTKSPYQLLIHLNESADRGAEEQVVSNAIRTHFARRAQLVRRNLRQLLRRGFLSLGIGIAFLGLLFVIARVTGLVASETGVAAMVRESMLIVGWVSMWRPLEVFLYDWWPLVGEARLCDRISQVAVSILRVDSALSKPA
jgi:hypothetical protein